MNERKVGSGGIPTENFNALIDAVDVISTRAATARIKFNYATPGLLGGIPVFAPTPGDTVLAGFLGLYTIFNGTNPKLNLYFAGGNPDTEWVFTLPANQPQWKATPVNGQPLVGWKAAFGGDVPAFTTDRMLMLNLTNGSGGNPNSTVGDGEFSLIVMRPG